VHGFLLDHLQAQDIVDYYPGNSTDPPRVKGRFRALMSAGTHESMNDELLPRGLRQWWEGGLYENEYIKQDGIWKIYRLRYYPFWFVYRWMLILQLPKAFANTSALRSAGTVYTTKVGSIRHRITFRLSPRRSPMAIHWGRTSLWKTMRGYGLTRELCHSIMPTLSLASKWTKLIFVHPCWALIRRMRSQRGLSPTVFDA